MKKVLFLHCFITPNSYLSNHNKLEIRQILIFFPSWYLTMFLLWYCFGEASFILFFQWVKVVRPGSPIILLTAVWTSNSHTIKFTHWEWSLQWFLENSELWNRHHNPVLESQKDPLPLASASTFPLPALCSQFSIPVDFLFLGYFIYRESELMWSYVTGSFHLALCF